MKKNLFRFPVVLCLLVLPFLMTSLQAQKGQKYVDQLMAVDKEFSDFSVQNGLNEAFFTYCDESAVLLKPDMLPIKGMEELKKFHKNIDDTRITLSWTPYFAKSAKKGDLGYTYGTWKMTGENLYMEGTYVTIWVKNENGDWKVILDTGNSGLGKKK